jgi:ketosteroid isomerase-like protein
VASEDTVIRFFAAIETGDIDLVRAIYAPDALIWHNDDLIEQPVEENLKVLPNGQGVALHAACTCRSRTAMSRVSRSTSTRRNVHRSVLPGRR